MSDPSARLAAKPLPAADAAAFDRDTFLGRVLDGLFTFVGILSRDGLLVAANQAPLQVGGLAPEEVIGKPFWDCAWWAYDETVRSRLRVAVEQAAAGHRVRYDVDVRMAGGVLMPIDFMLSPLRDESGRIGHLVASAVDITERRRMESQLRRSEAASRRQLAELEAIYRTAPVGLCVIDPEYRFARMNERLAETNGLPAEAHIGRSVREIVPDLADQAEGLLREVFATGQPVQGVEIEGETPAQPGKRRVWRENYIPLFDGMTGRVIAVNVVAEEITERKVAETRLRESEARARALAEQRELLMQELNHRVKNSLALVASMLALQRRHLSGEADQALADAQRRILTIAAVHQNLCESTIGDRIDLAPFAEMLVTQAAELRPDVETRFASTGSASLTSNRAVSFGLLLNELVVNALKHAFGDGAAGRVSVGLALRDGAIALTVADNGSGLPEGWTLADGTGLGSRLIQGLADQLDAEIDIRTVPGEGVLFEIAVPIDPPRRPEDGDG